MNSITGFQLDHPHSPDRIVSPLTAVEVAAAVRSELSFRSPQLAVQSTGHGRTSGMRSGTLIATSRMNDVSVDPSTRTVTAGAGARFAEVMAVAARHGLAPLSGSFPGVGIAGYSLSGGVGLLSRKYGFASDNVLSAEIVTPDGGIRTANAHENPELFWALRGAGSNFGIVTSLTMRVFPIEEVLGGSIVIDLRSSPGAGQVWREWAVKQDRDMMTAASIFSAPTSAADLPAFLRGIHQLRIQLAWSGTTEFGRAERLEGALLAAGAEFESSIDVVPFARTGEIFAEPDEPHSYGSEAFFLRELGDQTMMSLIAASAPNRVPSFTVIGLRLLGGAMAEAPETANERPGTSWGHMVVFRIVTPERERGDSTGPSCLHCRRAGRPREPTRDLGPLTQFHLSVLEPRRGRLGVRTR
ncbi:MAG: FAD-binding oxidoreductase [Brevibacterium sp.]|nr:FAD-binding oxidoreductase [Brevibacterium sp.]